MGSLMDWYSSRSSCVYSTVDAGMSSQLNVPQCLQYPSLASYEGNRAWQSLHLNWRKGRIPSYLT